MTVPILASFPFHRTISLGVCGLSASWPKFSAGDVAVSFRQYHAWSILPGLVGQASYKRELDYNREYLFWKLDSILISRFGLSITI